MIAGLGGLLKAFLKALLKEFLKKKEPRSVENSVSYTRTRAREGHFFFFLPAALSCSTEVRRDELR
jgi:hypothetical protein